MIWWLASALTNTEAEASVSKKLLKLSPAISAACSPQFLETFNISSKTLISAFKEAEKASRKPVGLFSCDL